jgi:RNA polymerase sigma-70 factor (ECF subfamily)
VENQGRFRNFLRRHVESDAAAEDILQQSVLKALRHAGEWDEKGNFLGWFYRILRNAIIDHYRGRDADRRKAEALAAASADWESGPPPGEERNALCACFEGLLPGLRPEYAELIRRIDLNREAAAFVAGELGLTANNLSVRLHRARQALKSGLEKSCGVCTRHGCLDCTCRHPAS